MVKRIAIVGAGGFGRETFELIRLCDPFHEVWEISGFISDAVDEHRLETLGSCWLGTDDDFLATPKSDAVLLAIGDSRVRSRLANKYREAGVQIESFIHPNALVARAASIGEGCILSAGCMIMTSCQIGNFVNVDRGAMVGHDSSIADFSTLNPATVISGGVTIGEGSQLGACACVLPNLTVGDWATVGAGSVVVSAVADRETVAGVPARKLQQNQLSPRSKDDR